MRARGRPAVRLIAAAAIALLAIAAVLLLADRDRPGDASDSGPATAGAGQETSAVPQGGVGAGTATGSEAPLQPLELGNLDEVPWQYRSRADEEAARRAAIDRVRKRDGSAATGIEVTSDQVADTRPVTGDGPESGLASPAIMSLPGPGETIVGGRRIGPSLPADGIPHAAPEAGGLRRPSAGPGIPDEPASSQAGPELAPADPRAPGPGG